MPAETYFDSILLIIQLEELLLLERIEHPDRFVSKKSDTSKSPVHIVAGKINKTALIENFLPYVLTHSFCDNNGIILSSEMLFQQVSWFFNVDFKGGIESLKSAILNRKTHKTKYTDICKQILLRNNTYNDPNIRKKR